MASFEEKLKKIRETDLYKVGKIKIDITEQICQKLEDLGWDKKDFAKELGTSPAYVTKLLSGGTNFTVETLYKVGKILNLNLSINYSPNVTDFSEISAVANQPLMLAQRDNVIFRISGSTQDSQSFWTETADQEAAYIPRGGKYSRDKAVKKVPLETFPAPTSFNFDPNDSAAKESIS